MWEAGFSCISLIAVWSGSEREGSAPTEITHQNLLVSAWFRRFCLPWPPYQRWSFPTSNLQPIYGFVSAPTRTLWSVNTLLPSYDLLIELSIDGDSMNEKRIVNDFIELLKMAIIPRDFRLETLLECQALDENGTIKPGQYRIGWPNPYVLRRCY